MGRRPNKTVRKQIDPEVLCLASLVLQDHEARLGTVMMDWLRFGASVLSVQRMKNLAEQFPGVGSGLQHLAAVAIRDGKDARWSSLVKTRSRRPQLRAQSVKQRSGGVALQEPAALVLRLRAAFNVGVKSDLLAFLLGQPYRVTVANAASALGYGVPAVFRALQDFSHAALVRSVDLPSAAEYWVDATAWYALLGGPDALPRWGYWREVLSYACAAFDLEHRGSYAKSSEYARASALRDLAERHESGLVRSGLVEGIPKSAEFAEWREFHTSLARAIGETA